VHPQYRSLFDPVECFNPIAAVMRAEALSRKAGYVGAIAFSRTGDLATADFRNANVIRKFGQGGKGRYACSCGAAGPFLPGIQDPVR
jgi:hypothetical protein